MGEAAGRAWVDRDCVGSHAHGGTWPVEEVVQPSGLFPSPPASHLPQDDYIKSWEDNQQGDEGNIPLAGAGR